MDTCLQDSHSQLQNSQLQQSNYFSNLDRVNTNFQLKISFPHPLGRSWNNA